MYAKGEHHETDNFHVGNAKEHKVENGVLYAKVEAPTYDVTITPKNVSFNAADYSGIAIRFKADKVESENPFFQVFFATDSDGDLSESKSAKCAYSVLTPDKDGYMTAVFDFSENLSWKGKITAFRFDPANSAGEYYIDKIFLVQ